MSAKINPLSFKLRVNGTNTQEREAKTKRRLFPAINNENCYQALETTRNGSCRHSQYLKSNKYKAPLSVREHRESENGAGQVAQKHSLGKKMDRPWAAKPKNILKTQFQAKLSTISNHETQKQHQNQLKLNTMKFEHFQRGVLTCNFQAKESIQSTFHEDKKQTRGFAPFRDRTNSCKIAIKKGVFPMLEKQTQPQRIRHFFEQEKQKLSTIPGNEQEGADLFLSTDSYSQLIF